MFSLPTSLSFTLPLALSLLLLLLLPLQAPAAEADILKKFNLKLQNDPEYSSFFKSYYSSYGPLAIFKELAAKRKVTVFIPSKAAFAKLTRSLTSDKTKFGNLISNHCAKSKIVSYDLWKKTKVGSYWTANFKNRKIYRQKSGVSLSDSKTTKAPEEKVVKWGVFNSPNLVAHAVDTYTITTSL